MRWLFFIRVPYRVSLFSVSDPAVLFRLSLFLQPVLLFLSDVLWICQLFQRHDPLCVIYKSAFLSFQIFFQVRCFSFFHGFLLVSRNLFGRYVKGYVFCISSKWTIAMPDNKKRTPSIGISTKREVSFYTPYFWKMLLKNNQYFTCKQISQTVKNP